MAVPKVPQGAPPLAAESSLREYLTSIRVDAGFYAILLAACGWAFYLHWNIWEDQSAQVYMTWGMFHGMKPYVDLIDPNWPGVLLPHTLAYLLSGVDAWGLRAVDLMFLLGLLCATSFVLSAWKTPRSLRLLAGCGFLLNYFGPGWYWTAERESFAWPVFVLSAIPFLLQLRPGLAFDDKTGPSSTIKPTICFFFGLAGGLSLSIKPVAALTLLVLLVMSTFFCDRQQRTLVFRQICWYGAGMAVVCLCFLIGLAATGTLGGFIKWGIQYDLGPYSQVKWPWLIRLWYTGQFLIMIKFMPFPLLLSIAGCVVVASLRLSPDRWRRHRRPLLAALALVLSGLMTALLQGKNHSLYHFIPMDWAIAFFSATIWSVIPWNKSLADAATAVALLAVVVLFIHEPATDGPTNGELAADRVRPKLSQQDQVVEWGYAPSLLASLQRRTPFQMFVGTSFITTSPADSWATRELFDRLNTALQNPAVRYLFVDQLPCFLIQRGFPYPRDYLMHNPIISATLTREYRLLPAGTLSGFDVFEHVRPAS